jgi:hypothetical protein
VLVARDGPISAIDPRSGGTFGSASPAPTQVADAGAAVTPENAVVRTVAPDAPEVELLAVRAAWVRVQAKDGTVIFEKILDAGERFALPKLEEPPVLRAGNSGSVYFAVNGETYGPAASGANVVKNVTLSPDALREKYQVADLSKDSDLAHFVALAAAEPMDGVPAAETTE